MKAVKLIIQIQHGQQRINGRQREREKSIEKSVRFIEKNMQFYEFAKPKYISYAFQSVNVFTAHIKMEYHLMVCKRPEQKTFKLPINKHTQLHLSEAICKTLL